MLSILKSNCLPKYLGGDSEEDNMYICVIAGILPTEVNSKRLPKILAISHTKHVFWLNDNGPLHTTIQQYPN